MIPENSFWRVQQECMAIPGWSRTSRTDARQEDCAPGQWNFTNQGWSLVQGGGPAPCDGSAKQFWIVVP